MLHRFARHELEHVANNDWGQLPWHRTAACGRAITTDDGLVSVRSTATDDGQVAYIDGVQRCGSVWLCPSCEATIKTHRQMELAAAAQAHSATGGHIGMLTLTVRHDQADTLATLQDALSKAWESLQQSARWREMRGLLVGTVVSKEVTLGINGWHPHLHILLLAASPVHKDNFETALIEWGRDRDTPARGRRSKTWAVTPDGTTDRQVIIPPHPTPLPGAWSARVYNRLGKAPDHHGFHFRWIESDAASYVAKIASETTRGDYKTTDAFHQILAGLEAGEAWAVVRWREWVAAMPGRRMLVWSAGLRAQLLPDVEDQADEDLVQRDRGGTEVGTLDRPTYRALIRSRPGQTPRITEVLAEVEATGTAPGLGVPRAGPPRPNVERAHRVLASTRR